jgi:hypothetical protein
MSMCGFKSVLAAIGFWTASCLNAQQPQLIGTEADIVGKAGPAEKAALYQFIGVMGSEVTVSVKASGTAAVTLYAPTGEEMLTEIGAGEVTLKAVLPLANVYIISVSRADPSKPFRLKLRATEPDLHQMHFAREAGYEVQFGKNFLDRRQSCWIVPGSKLRRVHPSKAIEEVSLGRNGAEFAIYRVGTGANAKVLTFDRQVRFEGETAIYTIHDGRNKPGTLRKELVLDPASARLGPYRSYMCAD